MEAELSSEEFKMREADFNVYPKGLIYGLSIMETWLYGGDPTTCLKFTETLDFLRGKSARIIMSPSLKRSFLITRIKCS